MLRRCLDLTFAALGSQTAGVPDNRCQHTNGSYRLSKIPMQKRWRVGLAFANHTAAQLLRRASPNELRHAYAKTPAVKHEVWLLVAQALPVRGSMRTIVAYLCQNGFTVVRKLVQISFSTGGIRKQIDGTFGSGVAHISQNLA